MTPKQTEASRKNIVGIHRMVPPEKDAPRLNCIAEVIEREHVSPRSLAQRLDMTVSEVLASAKPTNDLTLSELYRWQAVLQVPIDELLVELDMELSAPVNFRCQLLKVMRTVRSIQESTKEKPIQVMALRLVTQLLEMMPELKHVSAWPSVGQRRTRNEFGAVTEKLVPAQLFHNPPADA
ncbi:MAG: hypothetical protein ACR2NM_12910 [Bythopirellula sp.]